MNYLTGMDKGRVTTTHAAGTSATTTSQIVETKGFNALLVHAIPTGAAWTVKLQGAMTANGTFSDLYDNNGSLMSTGSISAGKMQLFVGIPNYIKVVATEDTNGQTITVNVQPILV